MERTRKEGKVRQQFFFTDVVVFVVEVVQSTGDGVRDENGKDEVQVWTGTKMSVPLLAIRSIDETTGGWKRAFP